MLLSCDVRSLSPDVLALLTNDEMLAIFKDPMAAQAVRLETGAGSAVPQQIFFETCPPPGTPPLPRQTFEIGAGAKLGKG
eukprot:SAG31_NODE_12011_length_978_cov_0.981797_2_plen_79_part_01